MPVLFEIRSESRLYSVSIEPGVLAAHAARMRTGVVIADAHFRAELASHGVASIDLDANEVSKSLDSIGRVIVRMRELGANRRSHVWAVGGGTIQDVAAFAASVYMRGIEWTYIPTTLLGMVDSCIGGKSSINVDHYKNLVGTFHPPSAVLVDPLLTATLTTAQRVAGLVEAAKICYCRGPAVYAQYMALEPGYALPPERLMPIIALSLQVKKWFVEIDEFDRAERLLLNLGHTFGHALEGASDYRLGHGIAVGVGILCALALSRELLSGSPGGSAPLLGRHVRELLLGVAELPELLAGIDLASALERLAADKKHELNQYRLVTFDGMGAVRITRLPKTDETKGAVLAAMRETAALLSV